VTEPSISDKKLIIEMTGWDKLWAFKSRLEIPLDHIKAVRADPEIARQAKGIRTLGTHVPGVIIARRALGYFGMFAIPRRPSSSSFMTSATPGW